MTLDAGPGHSSCSIQRRQWRASHAFASRAVATKGTGS